MAKPTAPELPSHDKGRLVLLLFFILLLYVALPRLHSFSSSFSVLTDADPGYVGAAALAIAGTYLVAAGAYYLLALHRLRFIRTLGIQLASAFANRLLPAGLGGLTLYVRYLHKMGHSLPQALAVAGTDSSLGMIAHLTLLTMVVVFGRSDVFSRLNDHRLTGMSIIIAVVVAALVVGALAFGRLRQYLFKLMIQVVGQIAKYRNHPFRILGAFGCSLAITIFHVAALYACSKAVGFDVSIWNAFIVFTIGLVVGTVTPTPGGLGGAEAGWVAGLIAYGAPAPVALAAVLLFRLLSYWLPLFPGFVAFVAMRRRYL